jgi:hypothetical protein
VACIRGGEPGKGNGIAFWIHSVASCSQVIDRNVGPDVAGLLKHNANVVLMHPPSWPLVSSFAVRFTSLYFCFSSDLGSGKIVWADEDVKQLLGPIAEVIVSRLTCCNVFEISHFINQYLDSPTRTDFLQGFKPSGKYGGVVGMFRDNTSAEQIGFFDKV